MKKDDLVEFEKVMMKEVVKRRSLGGYNSEAESVLLLSEVVLRLIQHLIDQYPRAKSNADKKP
jgi:hypothetical protein